MPWAKVPLGYPHPDSLFLGVFRHRVVRALVDAEVSIVHGVIDRFASPKPSVIYHQIRISRCFTVDERPVRSVVRVLDGSVCELVGSAGSLPEAPYRKTEIAVAVSSSSLPASSSRGGVADIGAASLPAPLCAHLHRHQRNCAAVHIKGRTARRFAAMGRRTDWASSRTTSHSRRTARRRSCRRRHERGEKPHVAAIPNDVANAIGYSTAQPACRPPKRERRRRGREARTYALTNPPGPAAPVDLSEVC